MNASGLRYSMCVGMQRAYLAFFFVNVLVTAKRKA